MWESQNRMLSLAVRFKFCMSQKSSVAKRRPQLAMASTTVHQSHKHPTLCTITVDGYAGHHKGISSPVEQPEHHWRLPNTDPRNEGKYLFRLHTLDIYFWTNEDAKKFMNAIQKLLQPDQVEILDAPYAPASHEGVMSPVVQQLENVAILDPAYRNGQTRNSTADSRAAAASPNASIAVEAVSQEAPKAQDTAGFQPLAYNPAAPPAPEPIKHREKTPPPEDAEAGTGLAGAAYRDHAQAISSQSSFSRPPYGQPQSSQGYLSPQPTQSYASSYGSPPPSAQGQQTSSVSSFPHPPPQTGRGSASPYTSSPAFAPPPQQPQITSTPSSQQVVPAFSPPPGESASPFYSQDRQPLESPATQILGDSYVGGHRQPLQHLQPQYANYTPQGHEESEPIGGYSDYQYNQQPSRHQHHAQGNQYDIHSQVYRPTPEEASKKKPSKSSAAQGSPPGRFEEGAGRVDKGVNRFFKKLEKKIG